MHACVVKTNKFCSNCKIRISVQLLLNEILEKIMLILNFDITWSKFYFLNLTYPQLRGDRGGTVVKVLCYKSEGRWFDSRWCHWNFSLT